MRRANVADRLIGVNHDMATYAGDERANVAVAT